MVAIAPKAFATPVFLALSIGFGKFDYFPPVLSVAREAIARLDLFSLLLSAGLALGAIPGQQVVQSHPMFCATVQAFAIPVGSPFVGLGGDRLPVCFRDSLPWFDV